MHLKSGLAAAVAAGLLVTFGCSAQVNDHPVNNPGSIFLSQEEAMKAAGSEKYANEANAKILASATQSKEKAQAILGASYAGTWVEYLDDGTVRQVIGDAGNSGTSQKKEILSMPGVALARVKYSISELTLVQQAIMEYAQKEATGKEEPLIYTAALSQKRNSLIIRARAENLEKVKSLLWHEGFDLSMLEFEQQTGSITFMGTVHGGTRIAVGEGPPSTQALACTTGFNVVVDNIYPASITAAHCYEMRKWKNVYFNLGGSPTGVIVGDQIGEFLANGWPDKMDAILFGNTNFVHKESGTMLATIQSSVVKVKDPVDMKEGEKVCTYGGTSGWRCGKVVSTSWLTTVGTETRYYTAVDFCGAPGDSGGPVVTEQYNALGIYVGAAAENSGDTCGSVFGGAQRPYSLVQPLKPYLTKFPNVKIRTD
ncbi:S1 family peptidase [Xanthomonas rydalmerensis]|uniref:S1 family peptidase n=1 Tax=Xanthomonas rydalmerensis TaxID=3046274 RepID=A0ABZ0JSB3_9XANT|nr:S1 family peptidase [Xanthomonas sp. DM-2023]WOS42729.1 S1 family peptidase [Xanthomonas sp. DM-2023]WOS46915.1 S1 family peptidase [Xanthomonas sp. DM-2023]WOS51094.1 S1 family peptidase [Xanthomonas sp. DM-2023]WOS55275.1 S1 family peptidase [Xanthomonas sp. DM-2023]WOS59457.1 S1 family peptidase [Xanthomonas sp. DM-2023]